MQAFVGNSTFSWCGRWFQGPGEVKVELGQRVPGQQLVCGEVRGTSSREKVGRKMNFRIIKTAGYGVGQLTYCQHCCKPGARVFS